jgi:hypothetical protein
VLAIANRYTGVWRDEALSTAKNLRLPYWNWDGPTVDVPGLISNKLVGIPLPSGVYGEIKNPLESYVFHPPMSRQDVSNDVSDFAIFKASHEANAD